MNDLTRTTLDLEVCAVDRAPVKLEATTVTFPGEAGEFEVLPGHAPLVAKLDIGVMSASVAGGQTRRFAVHGGLVRILENHALVLAYMFEMDTEIDVERAEAKRAQAERILKHPEDTSDVARAEVGLKRALMRLRASSASNILGGGPRGG